MKTNITQEDQKESEQKDFKESFDAVMKPVVDWLNLKPEIQLTTELLSNA